MPIPTMENSCQSILCHKLRDRQLCYMKIRRCIIKVECGVSLALLSSGERSAHSLGRSWQWGSHGKDWDEQTTLQKSEPKKKTSFHSLFHAGVLDGLSLV